MSFILITPQSLGLNAIPKITWGSFRGQCGKNRGSFRGRDQFGVDLEIISGAVQIESPMQ